jgi:hypothetical protein
VVIKFSNSHFHIQNCRFRALFVDLQPICGNSKKNDRFNVNHPLGLYNNRTYILLKKRDYSGSRVGIGISRPRDRAGSGLKKIYKSGPGGIGIEKKIMSRDRAGSGLKTHPVLEHCLQRTDPEYLNDTNNAVY